MHDTSTATTAPRIADLQLHLHLRRCRERGGLLHQMQCWSEALYDTVAPRLVTTTAVVLTVAVLIDRFI